MSGSGENTILANIASNSIGKTIAQAESRLHGANIESRTLIKTSSSTRMSNAIDLAIRYDSPSLEINFNKPFDALISAQLNVVAALENTIDSQATLISEIENAAAAVANLSNEITTAANSISFYVSELSKRPAIVGKASAATKKEGGWVSSIGGAIKGAYDGVKKGIEVIGTIRSATKEIQGIGSAWRKGGDKTSKSNRVKNVIKYLTGWSSNRKPKSETGYSGSPQSSGGDAQNVFVVNWPDSFGLGGVISEIIDFFSGSKPKRPSGKGGVLKRIRKGFGNAWKWIIGNKANKGIPAQKNVANRIIDRFRGKPQGPPIRNYRNRHEILLGNKAYGHSKAIASGALRKSTSVAGSAAKGGGGFLSGLMKKATGFAGKIGGGTLLKSFAKKIPGVSLVMGGIGAVQRAMKGDWLGALGEVASGVAGMVPGIGTAVSTVIDGGLIARDMLTDSSKSSTQAVQKQAKTTTPSANHAGPAISADGSAKGSQAAVSAAKKTSSASKAAKGTAISSAARSGGGGFLSGMWKKATSVAGKIGGGSLLKGFAKKIPGVSLVMGGIGAVQRAMKGDWLGALGEVASGVAGMVPGIGTAVSTVIDGGLVARDMLADSSKSSTQAAQAQAKASSSTANHGGSTNSISGAAKANLSSVNTADNTSPTYRSANESSGGLLAGLWQGFKSSLTGIAGTIIPGGSLVMSGIGAAQRAIKGDWLGSLGEAASGAANLVPGMGAILSIKNGAESVVRNIMPQDSDQAGRSKTSQDSRADSQFSDSPSSHSGINPPGGGFQVSINQVVNLAAGATAEGLEATLTQGRDRLRQEVEIIVRDMFHRQRRVSFGSVSA